MNTSIGERIKSSRKAKGLTQTDIYKLTGISSGNLSDIENNKTMPSSQTLISLSRELSVSIDWILTGHQFNQEDTDVSIEQESLNVYESELLHLFRKLSFANQMRAIGYIESSIDKKAISSNSTHGEEAATDETA